MGPFDALNRSESAKTATELASITGGDRLLIGTSFRSCRAEFRPLILSSPHLEAIGCHTVGNRDTL